MEHKEFRVRAIEEKSLVEFGRKLQNSLNRMDLDNFSFTIEKSGHLPVMVDGENKFLALIIGERPRPASTELKEDKENLITEDVGE